VHWTNGGLTELHNLILLCSFHHHVVHEGGWNIDPSTHDFIKPTGAVVDRAPSERFRGSALATAQVAHFMVPAPLAEAENERLDLGMVLESLTFDDDENYRRAETARWRSRVAHGPPIPVEIVRQRIVAAHRTRSARLYC